MGYAFISYQHKDKNSADKIKSILELNDIETWIDKDEISVGSNFDAVILKAIKNCSCFVLLLSSKALASKYVIDEFSAACRYQIPIVPIKLEEFELDGPFDLHLGSVQHLSILNFDESSEEIKKMVAAVKSCTDKNFNKDESIDVIIPSFTTPKENISSKSSFFGMKKSLFAATMVTVCAVLLAIIILLISSLSPLLKQNNTNNDFEQNHNNISSAISSVQEQITDATQGQAGPDQNLSPDSSQEQTSSEVASSPVGENQLLSEYDDDIEALKYSDAMSLSLNTLRIKVGEGATPQSARVWKNVTIYSQNTAVAIGDGLVVKGVAKGETYIVVQSNTTGMSQVYYVIVE